MWSSLGISDSGSTGLFLTQRGVFAAGGSGSGGSADSVDRQPGGFTTAPIKFWSGTKLQYETLSGAGEVADDILYNITDTETAMVVTKMAVDDAIGASSGGNATLFYNQLGNWVVGGGGDGGEADSIIRQAGGSTVDPMKVWTGSKAQYDALSTVDPDTLYSTTDESQADSTTVTGTANQIDVSEVDSDYTVSLNTAITGAITANTAKTGISTAQASAITANTAKTGITTAQASAITANTAKVSVAGLTQVGGAIIATDSVLYYDNTTPRRKTFSSVPLSVFNNDAGFVTSAGDAFLANTQTFTGANTFSNAAGIRATNGIARETGGSTTDGVKFWSGTVSTIHCPRNRKRPKHSLLRGLIKTQQHGNIFRKHITNRSIRRNRRRSVSRRPDVYWTEYL